MDKYEFNIKAEQMRKMIDKGDYKTAMQIADTIDWRRVRNANLLASVAEIYEVNHEYEEAKDILLLAFERAPIGKRFLFKLAEISVKAGDIQDA
jgi:thioredoxin-like negative regulator of GroEL